MIFFSIFFSCFHVFLFLFLLLVLLLICFLFFPSSFLITHHGLWGIGIPDCAHVVGVLNPVHQDGQRSPGPGNINLQELFWRSPSWHKNLTWHNSLQVPTMECFRPNNWQDRNETCPSADRLLKVILRSQMPPNVMPDTALPIRHNTKFHASDCRN